MDSSIKIGTVNLQNNKINRTGGLREDGIDTAKLVAKHIENEKFDILGTQELTSLFINNIINNLETYKLYGGYRYGNGLIGKIVSDFNETNSIITNHEIIEEQTKNMPFIPNNLSDLKKSIVKASIMPRIITIIVTKINGELICAMNTHLDYQIPNVQIKQLEFIKNLVKVYSEKYPVILTGDFNMEIGTEHFDKFNSDLSEYGIKRVEVNDKTNANKFSNKTAIDHIFIPNEWEVVDKGTKTIENVTDHKEVFVEIRKR